MEFSLESIWVKVLNNFGCVCFVINEEGSDVSYMALCLQRLFCMPRSKACHNAISVSIPTWNWRPKFLFSSKVLVVYIDGNLSIQSSNGLQLGLCKQYSLNVLIVRKNSLIFYSKIVLKTQQCTLHHVYNHEKIKECTLHHVYLTMKKQKNVLQN